VVKLGSIAEGVELVGLGDESAVNCTFGAAIPVVLELAHTWWEVATG